jgi:hypothetical protein
MEEGHSAKLRSKVNMAIDCLRRAHDGMESESWPYVLDQLGKATLNVAESAFLADTCKLLHERAVMERLKAFRGRVC